MKRENSNINKKCNVTDIPIQLLYKYNNDIILYTCCIERTTFINEIYEKFIHDILGDSPLKVYYNENENEKLKMLFSLPIFALFNNDIENEKGVYYQYVELIKRKTRAFLMNEYDKLKQEDKFRMTALANKPKLSKLNVVQQSYQILKNKYRKPTSNNVNNKLSLTTKTDTLANLAQEYAKVANEKTQTPSNRWW